MYAGSLVAVVTPMQPTGGIDYEAWSRLLASKSHSTTTGSIADSTTATAAPITP